MADDGKHIDVIICGAGIMGISTAYFLAKRGVFSIVIEKDMIANAASGKAGGFLARDWNQGSPLDKFSEFSFDLHADLADELNGEMEYGYRRTNCHTLTLDENVSNSKSSHNKLPSWLDLVKNPSMQIGNLETCAQVHPYQFCQTLRKACSNMGVIFLTKNEVTNIAYSKEKPKIITMNNNKQLSADVVIIAMGPWTGLASKWFPTITSFYGQKAHSITVHPNALLSTDCIMATSGDDSHDVYPRPDGEAYVCGIAEKPKPSEKLNNPGSVNPSDGACEKLKTIADKMSSSLRDGDVTVEQACYLPLTQDGLPIIGKVPDFDGVYVAAGHGCWGILNAPATGKCLSELVLNGVSTLDISAFSPSRKSV
ncbi:uncharacterized protein LOC120341920 [Styela clava]